MNGIYLDNSATTAVCKAAADKAYDMMLHQFGNPSSLHRLGFEAEREIEAARQAVAELMGGSPAEVIFTSGGSEANNLAVFGAAEALKRRGKHVVTTAVEHASVAAACDELEKQGFEVTRLSVGADGLLTAGQIADACRPDTVLVSVMLVNNETGARFPIDKAIPLIRRKSPHAFIHSDAVQAAGKIPLSAARWGLDGMTVTAHKLHGPKGCGALYLRRGARLCPRQFGGKQQQGIRPGTEAAPFIAAFGAAIKALPSPAEQQAAFTLLRQRLIDELADLPVVFHLPENGVPYIVNLSLPGLKSETMLHFLSERNIFVSSGSACSKGAKSSVLTAMGLPVNEIDSALRISFCHHNTVEEIDRFAKALKDAYHTLVKKG